MTQHTPGPWILDAKGYVYAKPFYRPAPFTGLDGVHHPDHMAGLVALPYNPDRDSGDHSANAQLIAAAPDLLDALKRITVASHEPVAVALAQEAIDKAEGRR